MIILPLPYESFTLYSCFFPMDSCGCFFFFSFFLGVILVRCWLLMVKVSWICYGGWSFCEYGWRLMRWTSLKNRGGSGGWSGGLALPCRASNDEAPTTMEDERVLKVRIECRSFLESGKNLPNPMIGNDCLLYRLDPRGKLENQIWVAQSHSSSWHLSEGESWIKSRVFWHQFTL